MKKIIFLGVSVVFFINGCGQKEPKMEKIVKKIVKVETATGSYTAKNKKSGAYGKYQIMPRTAKHYTRKLDMNHLKWKSPDNQDKIFKALLVDNVKVLKKNGYPINAFTVYGCHQQGATGFQCIMNDDRSSPTFYKRIRSNLPKSYKYVRNDQLRGTWINYWSNKLNKIN